MNPGRQKLLYILYVFGLLCLLVYSYTQVDLSLTLSKISIWQSIQKTLQYVGYFQRPLSTTLYCILLIVFFTLYVFMLRLAQNNKLNRKTVWSIIVLVTVILVFSYPAFSYDMFNYMFTAKTVLFYQKNPYVVIPLNFAGVEPWLSFMHWTHNASVYTPLWIGMTLVPYLFGFGFFLAILFNTKILLAGFYLLTAWFVEKSLEMMDRKVSLISLIFFSLNPLTIIESLVSSHNDIAMMAFAMGAYYFYLKKQSLYSFLMLSLSIASKFVTIFWLPLYFFGWKKGSILFFSVISFFAILTQREVQGWYFLLILPVVALQPARREFTVLAVCVSCGLLLRYIPFLYFGDWNAPVPTIENILLFLPILFGALFLGINWFRRRKNKVSSVFTIG